MNKIFSLCASFLISFTAAAQVPANDNCSNAVLLTPSINSFCATTTAGTTVDATASAIPDCNGNFSKDVWYKFVATQTYHKIIVRDATLPYLTNLQLFSSADGSCSNLVSKDCTDNNGSGDSTTYKAYNLTIGGTYFVKVFSKIYYTETTTFNICVTSPPTNITKPVNDSCQNATILIPSPNANILAETNGTCVGATPGVADCYGRQSDDVWYKFQAIAGNHKVIVKGQDFLENYGIMEYRWDECNMYPNLGICVTSHSADSMVYSMKNLTIGQYYYFRVTTDADAANRAFTISVTTPVLPPNDECVDAQILVPHPDWAPTTGTTKEATTGENFYVDCNYSYTYDVWYKFTATKSSHQIRVKGADFVQRDGKIQFFTGDCNNLVSVGCTDTYDGDSIVYNAAGLNPGETYIFKVYSNNDIYKAPFEVGILSNNDDCESADSVTVNSDYRCLSVTKGATINATASSQSVCTGNADDDKWYKFIATGTELNTKLTPAAENGIDNAVMEIFSGDCTTLNSLYCVNNTTGSEAEEQLATGLTIGDTYYIRVYSYDDNAGKGDFELCISSPIPANDECISATQLIPGEQVCNTPTLGSTIGATQSAETACSGNADDDVWYKFAALSFKHRITLTPTVTNGIENAVLEVYSGNCGALNLVNCFISVNGMIDETSNNFTTSDTFYIRIHSYDYNSGNGDFTLCVSTGNEACGGAQTLTINPGTDCSTVTNGTTVINGTGLPSCTGTSDDELWYKFTATSSAHKIKVTPSATNGINDVVLEVLSGNCGALNNLYCVNNTSGSAPEEILLTNLIVGSTYFVRVYSYAAFEDAGDFDICVITPQEPPANDECTGAVNLNVIASTTCTNPVNGTTIGASQSMPACNQTTTTYSDDDVWYKFTAIGTTTHLAITPTEINGLFDPVIQLFQGNNCGEIGNYGSACYDNIPGTGAIDFWTQTQPGATYYFRIYSAANGTGQGDFTICAYFDGPANDDCSGAENVPVNNDNTCTLTTAGTTVYATSSNTPPGCTSQLGGTPDDDVWYKFTATATSHIITVTPTAVGGIDNVVLRMFEGNCNNFTYNTCINNTIGEYAESYAAQNLIIGNTYYFSVHSYINSYTSAGRGAFTICIKKKGTNDECTGALTIPVNDDVNCTNVYQGSTLGATTSPLPVGCGSLDVWYKFVANATSYNIAVTPPPGGGIINPVWELISGTCANLTSLGCQSQPFTYQNLTIGNTYYLRVASNYASGDFTICVKRQPVINDDCSGATNLSLGSDLCNATLYSDDTEFATTSIGAPAASCDGSTAIKDVWYKFTPASNGTINIEITNATGPIVTQILTGTCGSLTELRCASGTNITNFAVTANTTYFIRIYAAGAVSSFSIKAYLQPVVGAFDFEHTAYYTASGNVLTNSNQTLQSFNYSTAQPSHPLLTDGVYYPISNLSGKNIWMRVRHIASDPNGTGIGFNVTATASSPFRSNGFGGWWGFLYQFDIYQDANLDGCRSNTLNGLYPVNIVMESIETLSQPEWLMFENLNPESSNWILNSINFTGYNPGSNPGFSATNIPYPNPLPGGFTSTFPAASKNIYAIDLGGGSYAEFKMSANDVSQFKYGYEFSNSGGYQGIRLSFGTAVVVPLRLLNFDALKNKTTVQLSWQTTNEINCSHFIVQHSANGTTFSNIGRVEARNISGNNDYSLTDASPYNGVNFYRLQMVDIDGKTTYSSIIKIVFSGKNELQVYPNPAKNSITVSGLQTKGIIKIISSDGKLVNQIVVVANTSKIDVSTLAKGIYLLQYNGGEKMQQIKFIKE